MNIIDFIIVSAVILIGAGVVRNLVKKAERNSILLHGIVEAQKQEWEHYKEWRDKQECAVCGAKFRDRPRDEAGYIIDTWTTETLCGGCATKRMKW